MIAGAPGASLIQDAIAGRGTVKPLEPVAPGVPAADPERDLLKSTPETLPQQFVNINVESKDHICFLWVQNVGPGEFRTFARNPLVGPIEINATFFFRRDVKQQFVSAQETWEIMMDFTEGLAELGVWFNSVIQAVDEKLGRPPVLIIADSTGPRVPWEMFHLDLENRIAVGSEMITVRWGKPIRSNLGPVKLDAAHNCSGKVLAHVDPTEWKKKGVVTSHGPLIDLIPNPCQDIHELLTLLKKGSDDVGFVYLLCHGVDEGQADFALGSEKIVAQQIRRTDLRGLTLELFNTSKAIVFMNACNSAGVMRRNDFIYVNRNVSIVDTFLAKGARGVIGTLDSVELNQAANTANAFFRLIHEKPGICVAEALRRLRAEVIGRMPKGDLATADQLQDWYHTFLYVFYGHPETSLRLVSGGGKQGGGEVIEVENG